MARSGAGNRVLDRGSVVELCALLVLAPPVCAVLFGAASFAYGLVFETLVMPALTSPGQPRLSYGQQAMISDMLVSGLGALAGLIPVVARFPRGGVALVVPISGAVVLALATVSWWKRSLSSYGPDLSDFILYVPLIVASGLVVIAAAVVGVVFVLPVFRRGG